MSSGSLDLGNLYGRLMIDYSGLSKAEQAAASFATNTQQKLDKLAGGMKSTGKVLSASVTAPLVGAGIASIKFANDFDKGMREVNSLLSEADKDFEGLKDQVRGVALALGTDLTDGAASAYQAISAGVKKDNIVDFLTVATKAAIGGVTQTEVAVDGLTTVMNAWGDSAGSANDVADVMFTAVKNGKTTFEELSASMFQAAGLAPELGVGFKEISAAVATMTAQGVPTSVAMTQMRQGMVALAKPNEEMTKLLKAAGIQSVRTSIAQKGLAGTYDIIRKASDKSGISLEKSVGSVEALGYVLKVTGQNSDKFTKNLTDMESSTGAANAAFEELDKARGFEKMMNTLKALATIVGDQLLPIITPIITSFVDWLSKANELDPGMVRVGVAVAAVAAAIGPLLLGAGTLLGMLTPLIVSAGGFGAALASLAAMAGPVGVAIAAIAGAAILLYQNWDSVVNFFKTSIANIIAWFDEWSSNSTAFQRLIEVWNSLKESGMQVFNALAGFFTHWGGVVMDKLNEVAALFGGWDNIWEGLKNLFQDSLEFITNILADFGTFFGAQFENLAELLKGNKTIWEFLGDGIGNVVKLIKDLLLSLAQYVFDRFDSIVKFLKDIDFKGIGIAMMQGLANGIKESAMLPINAIKGIGAATIQAGKNIFGVESPSKVFAAIGGFLMDGLGLGIKDNTGAVVDQMLQSADAISEAAKEKLLKEQAHHEQSLTMMKEAEALKLETISGYAALREQIESKHANNLMDINRRVLSDTRSNLDSALSSLESFSGKRSGIYKAMFAVSKGFAIAESLLAMYQNIANASKVGFPYNIPLIAGAMAQGASIIANVKSAGAFNNGGYIPSGQVGMVGEKGAEFVSGPANVFSTQNTKELLNGKGNGGSGEVNIIIQNLPGQTATVSKDKDNATIIRIAVDTAKRELAHEARTGGGTTIPAILKAGGQKRRA